MYKDISCGPFWTILNGRWDIGKFNYALTFILIMSYLNFLYHKIYILNFRERFGIVYVDYNDSNRTRILKKSASWWENVIAAEKIDTS